MNYMKSNKNGVKLLAIAMVFVMAFAAVGIFVSESDAETSVTGDISADVSSTIGNMVDSTKGIYNQTKGTNVKNAVVAAGADNSNYWVAVGDFSAATSVKIGNFTYNSSAKEISVGNDNKLSIEVWKIDKGKLYIGAPYLIANADLGTPNVKITIGETE